MIGLFKERHPDVEPILVLNNSAAIIARVARRELDLGFIGTNAVGSDLAAIPCWDDEVVIIARSEDSSREESSVNIASLQFQVFVMRERGSATRQCVEEYLRRHGLTVKSSMTAGSPEAVKRHVAAGLGWGFASKASVTDELAAGQLTIMSVDGWDCRRTFYAIHRKHHRLNIGQRRFLELAQSIEI